MGSMAFGNVLRQDTGNSPGMARGPRVPGPRGMDADAREQVALLAEEVRALRAQTQAFQRPRAALGRHSRAATLHSLESAE